MWKFSRGLHISVFKLDIQTVMDNLTTWPHKFDRILLDYILIMLDYTLIMLVTSFVRNRHSHVCRCQ